MRRRNVVPRGTFASVALSCLILLAACTKGKESADSVKAIDTSAAHVVAASANAKQTAFPGTLPKSLDSLSGDELYDFTRKLAFGGGVDKERRCVGAPECSALKPARTKVRLDAVDGQDSLGVVDLPVDGVIAIRALNEGEFTEKYYGMKAGKNLEYFLVVLPGTKVAGSWRLEQLETTAGARRHSQVATGTFNSCGHPFSKKVIRADFRTCADAKAINDSVSRSGLSLQPGNDAPMWVTCVNGCCTGTMP